LLLWVLVALALVGAGWLVFRPPGSQADPYSLDAVKVGGPFTLTDAKGQPFPSAKLAGKPYAIFFGFTHCPDVCPTTLARLVNLRHELNGKPISIVFVTVDPERDGPKELGNYLSLFSDPVIGLTGSPAQIDRVKRQFGIYSKKVPDPAGGYTVDHTASVLLFDRNGEFVATISAEEDDAAAFAKLKRITGG
jgi:protein SCO1/2